MKKHTILAHDSPSKTDSFSLSARKSALFSRGKTGYCYCTQGSGVTESPNVVRPFIYSINPSRGLPYLLPTCSRPYYCPGRARPSLLILFLPPAISLQTCSRSSAFATPFASPRHCSQSTPCIHPKAVSLLSE
ncbi:unnamed protein product [Ectocarpus sp. 4 AP-2014]